MAGETQITVIGNLTADPELTRLPDRCVQVVAELTSLGENAGGDQ